MDFIEQQGVSTSSSLKTLHPFVDKECIFGVGGPLQQSTLPYQTMHQMILPSNHRFTKLVVSAEHTRLHQAGPQLLIASLWEKYWIPRIRNLVNTAIHQFLTCYRFKAQGTKQLRVEVPSTWVQPCRPFLTTGVDYAEPISLRLGTPHSKMITKGYIAIFVCFMMKAVYIEVFTSLTTEAFLATLRRFIARWGKPKNLFRQWYQLSRCCKRNSWNLQDASINITGDKGTGILDHWRMRLGIHSTTWTSLWRIMGSSSEIHEVPSAQNTGFSHCHLRGTMHITCSDRGLFKLQNLVCLMWWFLQHNIFVSWTFSNWWTTYPFTCCWL